MALGYGEVRDEHLPKSDGHVAAIRHLQRVGDRLRVIPERLPHLVFRLEVELLRREAQPLLVRKPRPGLDAQEHVVSRRVLLAQIVNVVGRDQLQPHASRELRQPRIDLRQLTDAGLLDLQVEIAFTKDLA